MAYQTPAHTREFEYEQFCDKCSNEGRDARVDGKGIHHNPYCYTYEPVAAHLWDEGWKGTAQ